MNRKVVSFALLVFFFPILIAGCRQADRLPPTPTPTIQPTTTPTPLPQIDGTILPGEWAGAVTELFADGSELLILQTADTLYLAIRASTDEMIAGNVFIQNGDEVRILHTSAALGTAIYRQSGDLWAQTKGFEWCCRETVIDAAQEAERTAFWKQEGWMGVNSRIGTPNELEYQIALGEADFRLAVNFLRVSISDEKIPFPAGLTDDCILPTPGSYPTEFHFAPETWYLVRVKP